MRFTTKTKIEPNIDLTPLIDVVFLLLIFFMITTTFVSTPGIKVKLPQTKSREVSEERAEINLVLTTDQEIFLGDKKISEQELSREFLAAHARNPDTTVILRADQAATHGFVVRIMDLARQAKLSRLAIATKEMPMKGVP